MRPERLLAQGRLRGFVGQGHALVGEKVAELRLLLVPDRLLQRDGDLRAAADLLDVVEVELELERRSPLRSAPAPAHPSSFRSVRPILFSFSTTCTGMRIVRALSASARATACLIHQVA